MFPFTSNLTPTDVSFRTVWIIVLDGAVTYLGVSLFSSHSQGQSVSGL